MRGSAAGSSSAPRISISGWMMRLGPPPSGGSTRPCTTSRCPSRRRRLKYGIWWNQTRRRSPSPSRRTTSGTARPASAERGSGARAEGPRAVAEHDLEAAPAAAARARLVDAGDVAHRRRLLADVELTERAERAPVLVAERQVVEEVLDGREAEARQLGGALRADAAHRLRGLGERGERRAARGRRRPVLAPRRWRRRRFAQRRQERVRAAQQPLLVARRALAERGQDALQLGERPRGARRPARPRARHALGERREREARLVEAPEVVRRQVLERRRERPEQLGERRRGRRHARR